MREAWPYTSAPKFLLFDHDAKFGREVVSAVRELGSEPVRTAYHSPWQNGVAERWVGSCRRDLLDHVIVLNERHLRRLMRNMYAITMRIERIWGWRRTRQPVAQLLSPHGAEARFDRCRDWVACTIAMRWLSRFPVPLASKTLPLFSSS